MNFSAIIDKNYIPRLNTLLFSLRKYCKDFNFFVIALDIETFDYFQKIKNCFPVSVKEIHTFYPELDKIEKERDRVSYIFTLSPFYPSYILEKFPKLDHICSLDSDQYFFSSPEPLFKLLDNYSVLITPHRFSKKLKELNFERFGKYNVSFQVFKRDSIGLSCLQLWREQCLNWCFDYEEFGWYADQKYLDVWQELLGECVYVIENKGVGLAPWNVEDVTIYKQGSEVLVDKQKLILYHYQGLKILEFGLIYTFIDNYMKSNPPLLNSLVYKPIISKLLNFTTNIDGFSRNNRKYNEGFLIDKSDFIFKIKFGFVFEFKKYLTFQRIIKK